MEMKNSKNRDHKINTQTIDLMHDQQLNSIDSVPVNTDDMGTQYNQSKTHRINYSQVIDNSQSQLNESFSNINHSKMSQSPGFSPLINRGYPQDSRYSFGVKPPLVSGGYPQNISGDYAISNFPRGHFGMQQQNQIPVQRQSMPAQFNPFLNQYPSNEYSQKETTPDFYSMNRMHSDYEMGQDLYENSTLNQSMDLMKMAAMMNSKKPTYPVYEDHMYEKQQMNEMYYQNFSPAHMQAPMQQQTQSTMQQQMQATMQQQMQTPMQQQVQTPMQQQIQAPIQQHMQAPMQQHMQAPIQQQMQAPMQQQMQAPMQVAMHQPIQMATMQPQQVQGALQQPIQISMPQQPTGSQNQYPPYSNQ